MSVDFQKTFGTVDHNIIIQKLDYYGVTGTTNNWFSSYLENRIQFVSINDYSSDLLFICCGVPQGYYSITNYDRNPVFHYFEKVKMDI